MRHATRLFTITLLYAVVASGAMPWTGTYEWTDLGARNSGAVLEYSAKVFEENGALVADVDGDGFQTMLRARCRVEATDTTLTFVLDSYRDENMFETYKPGEKLFTLRRAGGKLLEAERIEQRTVADLEMMVTTGFCSGIENYSRYLTGRK